MKQYLDNIPEFTHAKLDLESLKIELEATRETIEPVKFPRIYQIETTAKCNLACGFCPRTTDLVANKVRNLNEEMPFEEFEMILDRMPWLKSLELFHFGEPFMQKGFFEFVKMCKARGIYTVVASNMTATTKERIAEVFEAGLDFLVMDVDSLNKERYEAMRVNSRYKLMRENVLYVLGKSAPKPYTVVQTINFDGKPEYTEAEFLEWSGGLKPDELRYKFFDTFRGEVGEGQRPGLQPEEVCREPFYGFTIHANGNVVPCDRDWGGENVMGNIFIQSWKQIWNGERYRKFREQMKSLEKPEMCKKCEEGRLFNYRSQPHIQVNMCKGSATEA